MPPGQQYYCFDAKRRYGALVRTGERVGAPLAINQRSRSGFRDRSVRRGDANEAEEPDGDVIVHRDRNPATFHSHLKEWHDGQTREVAAGTYLTV